MALIKSPLFDGLWGKIGDLEFRMRKNKKIELAKKRIPMNRRSEAQLKQRERYKNCLQQYYKLTPEQLKQYEEIGRKQKLDAFRAFMAECLKAPIRPAFDNDGGGTWNRYINIPLTAAPAEYTQYTIELNGDTISVYSADGTLKTQGTGMTDFWNNVKTDGADIRAFDNNKNQLYFYIETFDYANQQAAIWVRVEANITELNIAYGNPSATMSSYNNPNQVFEFFDDFNFFEGWSTWGTINTEILDGVLHIHGVNAGDAGFYRTDYQFSNLILETREKIANREPASPAIRLTDNNNMYFFAWYWLDNNEIIRITKRVNGQDIDLAGPTSISAERNVWRNIRIIANGTNLKMEVYTDGWKSLVGSISASDTEFSSGGIGFRTCGDSSNPSEGYIDWVRVLKLADPASFGTPAIITI